MKLLTRTREFLARPTGAAAVSRAAGATASVHARRGTVLVLILGALAIISIVTLLYFTVGRSDTRTAAATLDRNRTEHTVTAIADYFNEVVSRSTFSTFVDGSDPAATQTNGQILIRKMWDYPFTDPTRRSIIGTSPSATQLSRRFNPTGSYDDAAPARADDRQPYQPWLSSLLPTELIRSTGSGSNVHPFNTGKDWGHISNFAPDGGFVNKYNLAPVVGGVRVSRFDALPARPVNNWTPQPSTATTSEMRWGLTLLDQNGRPGIPGQPQALPGGLGNADPNVPAHWTMWQQQAFRLSKADPFHGPGDPRYAPYQWADADGDGFFDSRWFELVDAFNPASPSPLLPRDDRFRWFIAARAIDLSGLINVNSGVDHRLPAGQASGAPFSAYTQVTPLGLYPEVDLYRMLRMNDSFQYFGFGYDRIQNYPLANSEFYGTYYDLNKARTVGEYGYNSLRLALRPESVTVVTPGFNLVTAPGGALAPMTGDARAQHYLKFGGQPSGGFFTSTTDKRIAVPGRFGLADLVELLERHGVNSPEVLSRLEQAVDGQLTAGNGGNANDGRIGPLRSNRTLAAEIGTADDAENAGQGNGFADDDAFARKVTDVRQFLTTESGGRQVVSNVVPTPGTNTQVGVLTANELPLDAVAAAQKAGATTSAARDPSDLFTGYATALAPYTWRSGHWSSNYSRLRTLSYGNNPELAIRLAAHLTANFGDSYDRDHYFSGYTLLLDRSQRGSLASSLTAYPWWTTQAGRLDLTDARLPDSSQGGVVSTAAVNIFGIEAQPFITQVSMIVLYTDAPTSAGGDDENSGSVPGNEPPITIRGTFSGSGAGGSGSRPNPDFLGQVLGFQLTNPFDIPVGLTTATDTSNYQNADDSTFSHFYLEFNGELFKLAREGGTGIEGVVLRPGETRTFYVLSNDLADMQARAVAAAGTGNIPTDAVERFIDNQLAVPAFPGQYTYSGDTVAGGTRVKPIRLRRMNPLTGASIAGGAGDLLAGTDDQAKRRVYLWRTPEPGAQSARPGRERHMLADRLFDPGTTGSTSPTLDRMIPASASPRISGTEAGPESNSNPPPASALDNTGFTIALWGTVKRADNPVNTPLGAIPAYCLEARWPSTNLRNFADTDGANPASLNRSDFTGNPANADVTIASFFTRLMIGPAGPTRLPPANNPGLFPGVFITADGTYATMTAPAHLKRHPPHTIGTNGNGRTFADPNNASNNLYPRIPLDNNRFEGTLGVQPPAPRVSTLRLADLLLPLAVGPEFDPGPSPPAIVPGQSIPTSRCLTLSEALALSLNYSNPPPTGDTFSIYHKIGSTDVVSAAEPSNGAVDRGQLNIRRFAPFEDFNTNLTFEPTGGGGSDFARWPGIPLALNILNTFRSFDPQFTGLTKSTPGQINVNTAAVPVLRTLPLLNPTTDTSSLPGYAGSEWQTYLSLSGANAGNPPLPGTDTDIAAAIRAYRDKTREAPMDDPGSAAIFEDAAIDPFASFGSDGRFLTTRVPAIRETPGIGSLGELMAITAPPSTQLSRLRATDRIDMLGHDTRRSGTLGTLSVPVRNSSNNKDVDEVSDDYGEQLLIAQSLMNSVNVRSDIFAVWFVVEGYQKSDTENLGVNDPLVPSIAKRFLLVLDRSNVTRAGEKARVLLFKELPM